MVYRILSVIDYGYRGRGERRREPEGLEEIILRDDSEGYLDLPFFPWPFLYIHHLQTAQFVH
jgi:hypothetical protein